MRIGVPAEVRAGETRVAATPDTVKRLATKNEVRVQAGAGAGSSIRDADFAAAGAKLVGSADEAYDADIVLKVRAPTDDELDLLKSNSILVGLLDPFNAAASRRSPGAASPASRWNGCAHLARAIDGRAVLAGEHRRLQGRWCWPRRRSSLLPMLMTAAGTVKASRVLILGVGVAGCRRSRRPSVSGQ